MKKFLTRFFRSKLDEKNIYLDFWKYFLYLKTPDLIQIVTLVSFFGVLYKNNYARFILTALISMVFYNYLMASFYVFSKKEIADPFSEFSRLNLNSNILARKWIKYAIVTMIVFIIVITLLPYLLTLSFK